MVKKPQNYIKSYFSNNFKLFMTQKIIKMFKNCLNNDLFYQKHQKKVNN